MARAPGSTSVESLELFAIMPAKAIVLLSLKKLHGQDKKVIGLLGRMVFTDPIAICGIQQIGAFELYEYALTPSGAGGVVAVEVGNVCGNMRRRRWTGAHEEKLRRGGGTVVRTQ